MIKFVELKQIGISVYFDTKEAMDNKELLSYYRANYLFVSLAFLSKGEINNMKRKKGEINKKKRKGDIHR